VSRFRQITTFGVIGNGVAGRQERTRLKEPSCGPRSGALRSTPEPPATLLAAGSAQVVAVLSLSRRGALFGRRGARGLCGAGRLPPGREGEDTGGGEVAAPLDENRRSRSACRETRARTVQAVV